MAAMPAQPNLPTALPSVTVLPFATPDDATLAPYFARGLAEEMIAALAAFDKIAVIPRNSIATLEATGRDRLRAARELGVRYLVSGTVRQHGDQLRLLAEVSDTTTGRVVWANVFTFTGAGLFDVLDSIVARVVGIVAPRIRSAEIQRAKLMRPESLTAYDHVLRGLDLISRLEQPAFAGARAHFDQAIALDPGYAMADALAGEWHSLQLGQSWTTDPAQDTAEAVRLLQTALDRDPANERALPATASPKQSIGVASPRARTPGTPPSPGSLSLPPSAPATLVRHAPMPPSCWNWNPASPSPPIACAARLTILRGWA